MYRPVVSNAVWLVCVLCLGINSVVMAETPNDHTIPSTNPADASKDARIAALEKNIAILQNKLDRSNSQCRQLQMQNELFLKELQHERPTAPYSGSSFGRREVVPAQSDPPAPQSTMTIIELPDARWHDDGSAEADKISENVGGNRLKLVPFDEALTAESTDPTHLKLIVHRKSKGLGTEIAVPAGAMWLDNHTLMLQWSDKAGAAEGQASLKYALLQVADEQGGNTHSYRFSTPVSASMTLNSAVPVKLKLPPEITDKLKLVMPKEPSDWHVSSTSDGELMLKQDDAVIRIKYDALSQEVTLACSGMGGVDAAKRVSALKAQYVALERETSSGNYRTAEQSEQLTQLRSVITEQTRALGPGTAKLINQIDALESAVAALTLPNDVEAAHITLKVAASSPQKPRSPRPTAGSLSE